MASRKSQVDLNGASPAYNPFFIQANGPPRNGPPPPDRDSTLTSTVLLPFVIVAKLFVVFHSVAHIIYTFSSSLYYSLLAQVAGSIELRFDRRFNYLLLYVTYTINFFVTACNLHY